MVVKADQMRENRQHKYLDGFQAYCHSVQIFHCEVDSATLCNFRARLSDLLAHPPLILRVSGELVQEERDCRCGGLVACKCERVHLCHELFVVKACLRIRRLVRIY